MVSRLQAVQPANDESHTLELKLSDKVLILSLMPQRVAPKCIFVNELANNAAR